MEPKKRWKENTRLDSVLHVLLLVLALGVLGVSAIEVQLDMAAADSPAWSTPA